MNFRKKNLATKYQKKWFCTNDFYQNCRFPTENDEMETFRLGYVNDKSDWSNANFFENSEIRLESKSWTILNSSKISKLVKIIKYDRTINFIFIGGHALDTVTEELKGLPWNPIF